MPQSGSAVVGVMWEGIDGERYLRGEVTGEEIGKVQRGRGRAREERREARDGASPTPHVGKSARKVTSHSVAPTQFVLPPKHIMIGKRAICQADTRGRVCSQGTVLDRSL